MRRVRGGRRPRAGRANLCSVPHTGKRARTRPPAPAPPSIRRPRMDLWTVVAAILLVVWAGVTFALAPAPGWVHGLLTAGVFLLIYRVVVRGTPAGPR